MLGRDFEDEVWSRFVFELVIWPNSLLWKDELNPRVRCAFGNVLDTYPVTHTHNRPWRNKRNHCLGWLVAVWNEIVATQIAIKRPSPSSKRPFCISQKVHFPERAPNSCLEFVDFAYLSLPWYNGWVALSFLVRRSFVCRPAMVTPDQISHLLAPDPPTHTFSEGLW